MYEKINLSFYLLEIFFILFKAMRMALESKYMTLEQMANLVRGNSSSS
jgi:hypothetical protein